MRLPFSVQVFLARVVGHERSYLLLQRNERPERGLPDFRQGISGALEPGESFAAAALRDVREETGIDLASVSDAGFHHFFPVRPEWRESYGPEREVVEEHIFYGLVEPSTEPVLSEEHKSWRWCSPEQATRLLAFGSNAACLQAVERIVCAGSARHAFAADGAPTERRG
jgi:dATP pyrophosphohydrolase